MVSNINVRAMHVFLSLSVYIYKMGCDSPQRLVLLWKSPLEELPQSVRDWVSVVSSSAPWSSGRAALSHVLQKPPEGSPGRAAIQLPTALTHSVKCSHFFTLLSVVFYDLVARSTFIGERKGGRGSRLTHGNGEIHLVVL